MFTLHKLFKKTSRQVKEISVIEGPVEFTQRVQSTMELTVGIVVVIAIIGLVSFMAFSKLGKEGKRSRKDLVPARSLVPARANGKGCKVCQGINQACTAHTIESTVQSVVKDIGIDPSIYQLA